MNNTLSCNVHTTRSFHLTQKVDYALFLLSVLARQKKGESQSLRVIAKKYSLSFAFLQKVAGFLQKKELIKGTRGKQGGYILAQNPRLVSVKEIIETVDGPIQMIGCLSHEKKKQNVCPRMQFCSVRSHLAGLNQKVLATYHNKKLSEIVKTTVV